MKAEKLAYFFEACELRTVFAEWPEEIGLALCLDEAGTCEMLLHHHDEGAAVLRKAAAVLDAPKGGFAVVPPVEGYPTRRVLFSDEQKLLKLVAGEDDLAEMAEDYLINYRFEKERKARPAPAPAPEPVAAAPKPAEPSAGVRGCIFQSPRPSPCVAASRRPARCPKAMPLPRSCAMPTANSSRPRSALATAVCG